MAKGSLKCIGNGIYLKNKFGSGYRVSTISSKSDKLISEMTSRWPSVRLAENEAGSMQFEYASGYEPRLIMNSIPNAIKDKVPKILNFLERSTELVSEWGISQPTLEEVRFGLGKLLTI